MIEIIKEYQKQYIKLIREFIEQKNKELDDYYLIFDKIELLYKRNKRTIFNFLENNKNFVFYGGATYFNKKRKEIYPILLANKKLIITDPILKLSIFLRKPEFIRERKIKEIIDRAIEHTIEIEKELQECYIIYINSDEFLSEFKIEIEKIAQDLTLQYLNQNLNLNFKNLDDLENEYKELDYELLNNKFKNMNDLVQTVNVEPNDTLLQKIYKNFFYSGINVDNLTDIQKIVMTLVGLFGQALELKVISVCLNVAIYVNRINVLMYFNLMRSLSEEDKNNLYETNILFCMYIFFRDYEFIDDYDRIIKYAGENRIYTNILEKCDIEKLSIEGYLKEIREIVINKEISKITVSKL